MAQPPINHLPDELLLQIFELVVAPSLSEEELDITGWDFFRRSPLVEPWRTPLTRTCQRWHKLACDLTIVKNHSLTIKATSYPSESLELFARLQKSTGLLHNITIDVGEWGEDVWRSNHPVFRDLKATPVLKLKIALYWMSPIPGAEKTISFIFHLSSPEAVNDQVEAMRSAIENVGQPLRYGMPTRISIIDGIRDRIIRTLWPIWWMKHPSTSMINDMASIRSSEKSQRRMFSEAFRSARRLMMRQA